MVRKEGASVTPESVCIDLPAEDGTLLRFTVHRDAQGGFFGGAQVEVQRHTEHGLRPVAAYTSEALLGVEWNLILHDGNKEMTVARHWMVTLSDWLLLMAESGIDIWKATA